MAHMTTPLETLNCRHLRVQLPNRRTIHDSAARRAGHHHGGRGTATAPRAGNGQQGFSGDGVTGRQTTLAYPEGVAPDGAGNPVSRTPATTGCAWCMAWQSRRTDLGPEASTHPRLIKGGGLFSYPLACPDQGAAKGNQ